MNAALAIQRLRVVIRRQHKALSTESNYAYWLGHYIDAIQHMPKSLSSERKLERFLSRLARDGYASASTQNQAFHAILFFYRKVLGQPLEGVNALRARRPMHLRHAPSRGQVQALLQTIRDEGGYPINLIARLLYGCGLRVAEPLNLRVKDVDLRRFRLCIRGAKGGTDRMVSLPKTLISIRGRLSCFRFSHSSDSSSSFGHFRFAS
jgi:integrase